MLHFNMIFIYPSWKPPTPGNVNLPEGYIRPFVVGLCYDLNIPCHLAGSEAMAFPSCTMLWTIQTTSFLEHFCSYLPLISCS